MTRKVVNEYYWLFCLLLAVTKRYYIITNDNLYKKNMYLVWYIQEGGECERPKYVRRDKSARTQPSSDGWLAGPH